MLKSEHDARGNRDDGSNSYYPYCCFNVSGLVKEMIFDFWIKLFLEMYFMPYKIMGEQTQKDMICKK